MVEFALVLPILILILMGVFDLGRGIYSYNVISNSAREGARYAVVRAREGIPASLNKANVRSAAMATAIGVDPSDITIDASGGSTNCATDICCTPDCEMDSSIIVKVHYRFHPITAFFWTLDLNAQATMTIE